MTDDVETLPGGEEDEGELTVLDNATLPEVRTSDPDGDVVDEPDPEDDD